MSTPFLDFIGAAGAARIAFHSCHNLIVHVVANYLYRPKNSKKCVSMMYWLTNHAVRRTPPGEREKQDISWAGPRPSKSHLIMFKCKLERIQYHASINYLELLDTKQFDGNKIDYSCNLSLCSIRLNFMQWKCMQKQLVCFSSPSETYQILGMRVGNFYLDSEHFFQDHQKSSLMFIAMFSKWFSMVKFSTNPQNISWLSNL